MKNQKSKPNQIPVIFTRYLYMKINVIISLKIAIASYDYESALFWAYELYYSGFEIETFEILFYIYETNYSKHHPKLGVYIKQKYNDLNSKVKDTIIATIIKNMMKKSDINEIDNPRFIVVQPEQIEKYKTIEPESTTCIWKHLRTVCVKSVAKKPLSKANQTKLLNIFRDKWLFCASFSPIWKNRIHEYHGKIDGKTSSIIFLNMDDSEEFYNRFNYEPDEQDIELQKKCLGII
jgi:hypothetical protein